MDLCLFNCIANQPKFANTYPFIIGSGVNVDLRIESPHVEPSHCQILPKRDRAILEASSPGASFIVNDKEHKELALKPDTDYALIVGRTCFYLRLGKGLSTWGKQLAKDGWHAGINGNVTDQTAHPLQNLLAKYSATTTAPEKGLMLWNQCASALFPLETLLLGDGGSPMSPMPSPSDKVSQDTRTLNAGKFVCPWCIWRFESKDILWVAKSRRLKGDPLLGPDEFLRFTPTRYHLGKGRDSEGNLCDEIACPHCHLVLPQSFVQSPPHIISLVGDAASGKSYFLSVLIKEIADTMARHLDAVFEDETPAANAFLNEMKNRLFSGSSPDQVRLEKTAMEGVAYIDIAREKEGSKIKMPRPFTYSVSSRKSKDKTNLVFYDNAGEHFQPGNDSVEHPGAQHVAMASGMMLLFDPFHEHNFRNAMSAHRNSDPQYEHVPLGNVNVILPEIKSRIANITGHDKLKGPLAFIVGKYDAWYEMVPDGEDFYEPCQPGCLSARAVEHNSRLLRGMLMDICPGIVARAENLSDDVRYFPMSTFGHSPIQIVEVDGKTLDSPHIVPDPLKLKPMFVEAPMIWLLSRISPNHVYCGDLEPPPQHPPPDTTQEPIENQAKDAPTPVDVKIENVPPSMPKVGPIENSPQNVSEIQINQDQVENNQPDDNKFTCRNENCGKEFDSGNILWVAKHPDLKGDPKLGSNEFLRFKATESDGSGYKALDLKGEICDEYACPHCHHIYGRID